MNEWWLRRFFLLCDSDIISIFIDFQIKVYLGYFLNNIDFPPDASPKYQGCFKNTLCQIIKLKPETLYETK